jgi:hypothetical protein
LVEIAPHLVHPTLKCPASELLEKLDDQSAVKRWEPTLAITAQFR